MAVGVMVSNALKTNATTGMKNLFARARNEWAISRRPVKEQQIFVIQVKEKPDPHADNMPLGEEQNN